MVWDSVLVEWGLWGLFLSAFLSATLLPGSSEVLLAGLLLSGTHSEWKPCFGRLLEMCLVLLNRNWCWNFRARELSGWESLSKDGHKLKAGFKNMGSGACYWPGCLSSEIH